MFPILFERKRGAPGLATPIVRHVGSHVRSGCGKYVLNAMPLGNIT